MPVRIYALAKDLDMDSKDLVDACTKAGITGKGSALASLDDDEVAKVKSFLEGPKAVTAKEKKAPAPLAPERPSRGEPRDIRVIPKTTGRKRRDEDPDDGETEAEEAEAPQTAAPEAETPPPEPAPEPVASPTDSNPATSPKTPPIQVGRSSKGRVTDEPAQDAPTQDEPTQDAPEPVAEEPPAADPTPAPAAPAATAEDAAPASDPGAPVRHDPLMPKRGDVGAVEKKPKAKPKSSKPRERRAPVIKLPKLPKFEEQTQPKEKKKEPAAQKPKMKLTRDSYKDKSDLKKLEAEQGIAQAPAAASTDTDSRRGGGGPGKKRKDRKKEDTELAGMTSRAGRQQQRRTRKRRHNDDDDGRRRVRTLRHTGKNTAAPRKGSLVVELPCSVRSFSEGTGESKGKVLFALMQMGVNDATINSGLDDETAAMLVTAMDLDVEFKRAESAEDKLLAEYQAPDDEDSLTGRPPIVTFLGHVDHGKTSLLDYLIGINVVSGEAGGITQHIRAYQVETSSGGRVSFVDTPGHAAFTEMRARGANVTDIVVLVVAADDGIMPQTEEAISHAKAAGVPIVVACNKIDLPGADANRVMTQLTEHELTPSEWGGEIEVVKTSAISGEGMDDLLETLLTIAELHEFRANADRQASGTCIEAQQEPGQGVVAKLVVRNGTLRVGDNIVCGSTFGRVKAIFDTLDANVRLQDAGPSMPVNITGFDTAPDAGETFYVVDDITTAREIAENRALASRDDRLGGVTTKVSFIDFQTMLEEGRLGQDVEVTELPLIIRADVRGSTEAILKELDKFEHPEVRLRTLQTSVGGITASDVQLANASGAVVVGFNVIPDEAARSLADELGVEIRRYDIIYKLTDDIKAMVEGKLKPEERVIELGRAVVREVYSISRIGTVAGCYVISGTIERNCRIRVNREGRTIGDYPLESLRRIKDDVKEVPRGTECGIKLSGFNDIKRDDLLEAYKIEEVARTL